MKTLLTPSAPVYLKLCFASQLLCPHFKLSVYYKQYRLIQSPSPGANVLKDPENLFFNETQYACTTGSVFLGV